MISSAKLEANRLNANQSTGPRSISGIRKSSKNALKHGLRSTQVVIPELEDGADYAELLDGLVQDFAPRGVIEELLVRRLADDFWRLRRVARYETELAGHRSKQLLTSLRRETPAGFQSHRELKASLHLLLRPKEHLISQDALNKLLRTFQMFLPPHEYAMLLSTKPLRVALSQGQDVAIGSLWLALQEASGRIAASRSIGHEEYNLIADAFEYWLGVRRNWDWMATESANGDAQRLTEALMLPAENMAIVARYETQIRRDITRTLAEIHAIRAHRRNDLTTHSGHIPLPARPLALFSPNEPSKRD